MDGQPIVGHCGLPGGFSVQSHEEEPAVRRMYFNLDGHRIDEVQITGENIGIEFGIELGNLTAGKALLPLNVPLIGGVVLVVLPLPRRVVAAQPEMGELRSA